MREWDETSFDFPLDHDSVVVEVGGFNGRWAAEIARRYDPAMYVFEPQGARRCLAALLKAGATRVEVLDYGLGDRDGEFTMGAWGTDGCSFLRDEEYMRTYVGSRDKLGKGKMRDVRGVFCDLGLSRIDLMLMNIEGYEYRLLPYMLASGLVERIRYLMVQFHEWAEPPGMYRDLCVRLAETHDVLWVYGRTLRTWKRWDD